MKYIDLHTHTIYSDGTCQPEQNVKDSALIGLEAIAITDHDTTQGYAAAKHEAKKWGIEIVPGVEISTEKYHILGYGFDVNNKMLQELLQSSRNNQENITKERIKKLQELGVPITFEKVKALHPDSRLGKGNILNTFLRDKECREYIGSASRYELQKKYLSKGTPASGISKLAQISAKEAIDTIHMAGGYAIIAHPFKDIDSFSELESLLALGLDGLEIQPNYRKKNKKYEEFAKTKGILITYGSDYHGGVTNRRPLLGRNENYIHEFWVR